MQVEIVGAHQGQAEGIGFVSLLIDGKLAIDAGNLLSGLSLPAQARIEAVLLTHKHWDHLKDLPGLAHNHWETKDLVLYCLDDTREALEQYFFNGVIWPRMTEPVGGRHILQFNRVEPEQDFDLLGYHILPITMSHTLQTVGY